MHIEERQKKNGSIFQVAVENFVDPLTGKRRRASISFTENTPRARNQARRDLDDKVAELIAERKSTQLVKQQNYTFGELIDDWFDEWSKSVKLQTIRREKVVIGRLTQIIEADILVHNITPLLVKKALTAYRESFNSSFSTMQHIKSTLNRIFDYAVLYNILDFSPSKSVSLKASVTERVDKKDRLEAKFLDVRETKVLINELRKRRNPAYYDLGLFLIGTGCRIGEAGALVESDFDFDNGQVKIRHSLQSHDLRVDDFYLDTTKTVAGDRVEDVPQFVLDAVSRCVERNQRLDKEHKKIASDAFRYSKSLFRTEYGSPITSHSFRELLGRINNDLKRNCEERYGFVWTKNAIPHSFRHIHISVLGNDGTVPLKEIQERVGHVEAQTTAGYTHRLTRSQQKSVKVISKFAQEVGITN